LTHEVLETAELPQIVRARALAQMGELAAQGGVHDCRQAVKYHMEAIRVADPLAIDYHKTVRRAAKQILIDSHLAIARDIAWGHWQQKSRAAPLWLARAWEFAEETIARDQGSVELRLRVAQHALLALAGFPSEEGPSEWVEKAQAAAEEIARNTDDALGRQRAQWQLGVAYFHAMQMEHMRGEVEAGLKYGELAVQQLESGSANRVLGPEDDHLIGQLFFSIGALHAVHRGDHEEAVSWYERAAPALVRTAPVSPLTDPKRHGDALVSMGVSYWELGQKEKAVELTKMGAETIRTVVEDGLVDQVALAVPFSNLAAMHEMLGEAEQAQNYAEMAGRTEPPTRR
jgi:tetratricopeptide (TPR) repeat protein